MAFYDSIKLEKGMYGVSRGGLTKTLEGLDPSENYLNTELAGLDAYQRQLKRFNIKVNGAGSDVVEKFFKTSDSAVLFPEYITRAVRQGMEEANILDKIIATKTIIDGMDYRTIISTPSADEKELKPVLEGSYIPQTVVKTQDNLVKLNKRGRMLVSSYEALRFQRLDLFTVTLKQIGAYIARSQVKDAINVILNGDGSQSAATGITTSTAGKLAYSDLISLWSELSPYELNTILAPTSVMADLLNLSIMQDAQAGLNFQGTGKLATPLGATLFHTSGIEGSKLIGLDKTCALEMVQAGDIVIDSDKLIDRQLERTSISTIAGFAKIFKDAAKTLTYKTA